MDPRLVEAARRPDHAWFNDPKNPMPDYVLRLIKEHADGAWELFKSYTKYHKGKGHPLAVQQIDANLQKVSRDLESIIELASKMGMKIIDAQMQLDPLVQKKGISQRLPLSQPDPARILQNNKGLDNPRMFAGGQMLYTIVNNIIHGKLAQGGHEAVMFEDPLVFVSPHTTPIQPRQVDPDKTEITIRPTTGNRAILWLAWKILIKIKTDFITDIIKKNPETPLVRSALADYEKVPSDFIGLSPYDHHHLEVFTRGVDNTWGPHDIKFYLKRYTENGNLEYIDVIGGTSVDGTFVSPVDLTLWITESNIRFLFRLIEGGRAFWMGTRDKNVADPRATQQLAQQDENPPVGNEVHSGEIGKKIWVKKRKH